MPEIQVAIARHGYLQGVEAIKIEGNGFVGTACRQPLQQLASLFNGKTEEADKPEAYLDGMQTDMLSGQ